MKSVTSSGRKACIYHRCARYVGSHQSSSRKNVARNNYTYGNRTGEKWQRTEQRQNVTGSKQCNVKTPFPPPKKKQLLCGTPPIGYVCCVYTSTAKLVVLLVGRERGHAVLTLSRHNLGRLCQRSPRAPHEADWERFMYHRQQY